MTDDQQRLRREAVEVARNTPTGSTSLRVLAMESLLTEAEARVRDLTAKLRRSRVMVGAQTADIERCERAIVREEVRATQAEATIATQAKEIERLRAYWLRHKAPDEAGL